MSKTELNYEAIQKQLANYLAAVSNANYFRINRANHLIVPRQWKIQSRANKDMHMIYTKSGKGFYVFDGKKELLEKGKVIFVSNHYIHSAYQDIDDPPFIIPVRFGLYSTATNTPVDLTFEPFYYSFMPANILRIEALFEMLFNYYMNYDPIIGKSICNGIISVLFGEMYESILMLQTNHVNMNKDILYVKKYIDNHPTKKLNIHRLSEMCGISEKYFTSLFKHYFRITPKQYMIKTRIHYAHFLLSESNESIKNIASLLNYSDQYAFSKQYKKVMGYYPSLTAKKDM